MDPGLIALLILGGIPSATLAGVGVDMTVRGVRKRHRVRRLAKLEATTPWMQYTDIAPDTGEYVVGIVRKSVAYGEVQTYGHFILKRLPPETSPLDVALAENEAMDRAVNYNGGEGRRT
jgi:hypothetical protein